MSAFPIVHMIQRIERRKAGRDVLGNDVWEDVEVPVMVAGWAVPASEEPVVAGHDRLTVDLQVYAPTGVLHERDAIRIEPYGVLEVVGHPQNYGSNPFGWDPGLEVVNTRRMDR